MPEIDAHSWKNKPLVLLEFRWPSGAKAPRGGWLVSCKNGAVLRVSIGLYGCHVGRSVVAVDLASRFDKWESMLLDRVYPAFLPPRSLHSCAHCASPGVAHGRGWLVSSGWIILSALLPRASLMLAICWSTLHVSSHVCIRALPENFLPLIYPPAVPFFHSRS